MAIKKTDLIEAIQNNKVKFIKWAFISFFVILAAIIVLAAIIFYTLGPICLDADDFGFPKVAVYSNADDLFEQKLFGKEVKKWKPTGLVANGKKVILKVKRRENPADNKKKPYEMAGWAPWGFILANASTGMRKCEYVTKNCNDEDNPCEIAPIEGPFCHLDQGMGLYALITKKGARDVNANILDSRDPRRIGYSMHMGEGERCKDVGNSGSCKLSGDYSFGRKSQYYQDHPKDKETAGYAGDLPDKETINGKLYFKIFDYYYSDNKKMYNQASEDLSNLSTEDLSNLSTENWPDLGYHVIVKNGFNSETGGMFSRLIRVVKKDLQEAMKAIYEAIVVQGNYNDYLRIALILHITIFGLAYLSGLTELNKSEILIRTFKIGIVATLMSDISWNFFYNYLFQIFTNGVDYLLGVIFDGILTYPAPNSTENTNLLDYILNIFLAWETHVKIWSLFLTSQFFKMLIIIPIIYISMFFFITACVSAFILYCIAYIATSILIIIAPIFIPFILFKVTKPLFESWLKQLISYFIQPLMVLAFLGFMATIALTQIHGMLGFQVCNVKVFNLPDFFNVNIRWFTPISGDNLINSGPKDILVPGKVDASTLMPKSKALRDLNKEVLGDRTLCDPYECWDYRYPGLPFLQAQLSEGSAPRDQKRIDNFIKGHYILFWDAITFAIILILTFNFSAMVPVIARGIADAQMSLANLGEISASAYDGFKGAISQTISYSSRLITVARTGTDIDIVNEAKRQTLRFKYGYQDRIGGIQSTIISAPVKGLTLAAYKISTKFYNLTSTSNDDSRLKKAGKYMARGVLGTLFLPVTSVALYSAAKEKYNKGFKQYETAGAHWRHQRQDLIGTNFDKFAALGSHAINKASFGIAGENLDKDGVLSDKYGEKTGMRDPNGKFVTKGDLLANSYADIINNVDDPLNALLIEREKEAKKAGKVYRGRKAEISQVDYEMRDNFFNDEVGKQKTQITEYDKIINNANSGIFSKGLAGLKKGLLVAKIYGDEKLNLNTVTSQTYERTHSQTQYKGKYTGAAMTTAQKNLPGATPKFKASNGQKVAIDLTSERSQSMLNNYKDALSTGYKSGFSNLGRAGQIGVAVGLINPVAGVGIGAVLAARAVSKFYDAHKNANEIIKNAANEALEEQNMARGINGDQNQDPVAAPERQDRDEDRGNDNADLDRDDNTRLDRDDNLRRDDFGDDSGETGSQANNQYISGSDNSNDGDNAMNESVFGGESQAEPISHDEGNSAPTYDQFASDGDNNDRDELQTGTESDEDSSNDDSNNYETVHRNISNQDQSDLNLTYGGVEMQYEDDSESQYGTESDDDSNNVDEAPNTSPQNEPDLAPEDDQSFNQEPPLPQNSDDDDEDESDDNSGQNYYQDSMDDDAERSDKEIDDAKTKAPTATEQERQRYEQEKQAKLNPSDSKPKEGDNDKGGSGQKISRDGQPKTPPTTKR